MVTTLIAINVGVFVVCTLTGARGVPDSPLFGQMAMSTPLVVKGQVWRIFTSQYLHWTAGHLLMNMLGLHFLGRSLEQEWGAKRFFGVYLVAGTLGMAFYMALTFLGWLPVYGIAAGASGCVLGLLGACAVRYPNAMVYIYFLFPIKIRTAALVFGGWYILNLYVRGSNAGGDACHLAGLIFGAWWAHRGERWWNRVSVRLHDFRAGTRRVRLYRAESNNPGSSIRQNEVDEILRKVYERGIHSLTNSEKDVLRNATNRQKAADSGSRTL